MKLNIRNFGRSNFEYINAEILNNCILTFIHRQKFGKKRVFNSGRVHIMFYLKTMIIMVTNNTGILTRSEDAFIEVINGALN